MLTRTTLPLAALALLAGTAHAQTDTAALLLQDAAARVSLVDASSASAGKDDKGFFLIAGEDFRLNLRGQIQYRYYFNVRDDAPDNEDITHGFLMRRVRIGATGHLATSKLTFRIETELASGSTSLVDTFLRYDLGEAWAIRAGQFKLPFMQEELNSHTNLLTLDRSVVHAVFSPVYGQGVDVTHTGKSLRWAVAFSDGARTENTAFDASSEAQWALTGRIDARLAGEWKQLDSFNSWRGRPFAAFLGLAAHREEGGDGMTDDVDLCLLTADASVKGSGWNVFASGVVREIDETSGSRFTDWGFMIQGGVFITDQTEVFARFDIVLPDSDRTNGDQFSEYVAGATYFITPESHALKLTGEIAVMPDGQADASSLVRPSGGLGLLQTDEEQYVFRAGIQASF